MKKLILVTALLLAPVLPGATAFAQTSNAQLNGFVSQQLNQQVGQLGSSVNTMASGNNGDMSVSQFNSLKAQALQKTSARISQLQREQRCGQAAATPDALHACYSGDSQIMAATTTAPSPYVNQGTSMLQQYGNQALRR